jgi:hypothetical protein
LGSGSTSTSRSALLRKQAGAADEEHLPTLTEDEGQTTATEDEGSFAAADRSHNARVRHRRKHVAIASSGSATETDGGETENENEEDPALGNSQADYDAKELSLVPVSNFGTINGSVRSSSNNIVSLHKGGFGSDPNANAGISLRNPTSLFKLVSVLQKTKPTNAGIVLAETAADIKKEDLVRFDDRPIDLLAAKRLRLISAPHQLVEQAPITDVIFFLSMLHCQELLVTSFGFLTGVITKHKIADVIQERHEEKADAPASRKARGKKPVEV